MDLETKDVEVKAAACARHSSVKPGRPVAPTCRQHRQKTGVRQGGPLEEKAAPESPIPRRRAGKRRASLVRHCTWVRPLPKMGGGSVRKKLGWHLWSCLAACCLIPGWLARLKGELRLDADIRRAAQQRSRLLSPKIQHITGSLHELGLSFIKLLLSYVLNVPK